MTIQSYFIASKICGSMLGLIYGFQKQAEFRDQMKSIKGKRKIELIRTSFQYKFTFEQRLAIEKNISNIQDDLLQDVYKNIIIVYPLSYFFIGMFYYVSLPFLFFT